MPSPERRPLPRAPKRIAHVIARREYEATVDGKRTTVTLEIGKPLQVEKPDPWGCDFCIRGLGPTRVRRVYGIDAIQALLAAMLIAEVELSAEMTDPVRKLRWLGRKMLGLRWPRRRKRTGPRRGA